MSLLTYSPAVSVLLILTLLLVPLIKLVYKIQGHVKVHTCKHCQGKKLCVLKNAKLSDIRIQNF